MYTFKRKKINLYNRKYNWSNTVKTRDSKKTFTWRRFPKYFKIFNFFLMNRQILRFFFCHISQKKIFNFHKLLFKKDKKRLYFQNFWLSFERRAATILFQTRVLSKIKFVKQFVLHRNLCVNGMIRVGYFVDIDPLDFVHLRIPLTSYGFSLVLNKIELNDDKNYCLLDRKSKFYLNFVLKFFYNYQRALKRFFLLKLKKRYFFFKRNSSIILLSFFFFSVFLRFYRIIKKIFFFKFFKFFFFSNFFFFFKFFFSVNYYYYYFEFLFFWSNNNIRVLFNNFFKLLSFYFLVNLFSTNDLQFIVKKHEK